MIPEPICPAKLRNYIEECRRWADKVEDAEQKALWVKLAEDWQTLLQVAEGERPVSFDE